MRRYLSGFAVTFVFCFALSPAVFTQDVAAERANIQTEWAEGKAVVTYGKPAWKDSHKDLMKEGFVWRLGNNDPTSLTLTCGLNTENGPIPPGDYKLACKCVTAAEWRLLVYRGTGLYEDGLRCWEIKPSATKNDATPVTTLNVGFDANHLDVAFGPHQVRYSLAPIKVHAPVETTFARTACKVSILALPVTDTPVKDLFVGTATVSLGNAGNAVYDLRLTTEGGKPTLAFANERPASIIKEKASLEKLVERVKARMGTATDEQKPMIEKRIATIANDITALDTTAQAHSRYQTSKTVDGTIETRHQPVSMLEFTHERPTGAIVFKFGVGTKNCSFAINPREFMTPRDAGH